MEEYKFVCPDCDNLVSAECVNCGSVIAEQVEDEVLRCPKCDHAVKCKKCGYSGYRNWNRR